MSSGVMLLIVLTAGGIACAVRGNGWLIRKLNPASSPLLLLLYIAIVLLFGLLLTTIVSYIILKLVVNAND